MRDSQPLSLSFSPLGDRGLLLEFSDSPDPQVSARVRALADYLQMHPLPGVTDIVPAFCSLALHYDPEAWRDDEATAPYDSLISTLQQIVPLAGDVPQQAGEAIEIPVSYGAAFGEDLEPLAQAHRLTVDEAIAIHSSGTYTVYMLGFAPGFAYLGPLDPRLKVPRHPTPRTQVPAGSVAVANAYTAIYPMALPGGWHLIGRTPMRMFDADRNPPSLLAAGDRVRFVPVSAAEFRNLEGRR
ncbi:MAG: 5-oxoprolinase subunit PxpB [Burkholderiales bacterium]